MAQIIQFPVKEQVVSNGYNNLSRLISGAETTEALNWYIESMERLEKAGNLLDGEAQKLEEQGKKKRLEMSAADPVEVPGVYCYTPEMGGQKPECQIEAHRSYYGRHYHIDTPLELKGRGIKKDGVIQAKNLRSSNQYKDGWFEYTVTERAFEKLKEQHTISQELLLD